MEFHWCYQAVLLVSWSGSCTALL